MINYLRLKNFQGFKLDQEIRLAPLTLLFGPNSSGKTAVLRALRLLDQSWTGEGQVVFNGPLVQLGGFDATVFRAGDAKKFEIAVGLEDARGDSDRVSAAFRRVWRSRTSDWEDRNLESASLDNFSVSLEIDGRFAGSVNRIRIKGTLRVQGNRAEGDPLQTHHILLEMTRRPIESALAWSVTKCDFSDISHFLKTVGLEAADHWQDFIPEFSFEVRDGLIPDRTAEIRRNERRLAHRTDEGRFAERFIGNLLRFFSQVFRLPITDNVGPIRNLRDSLSASLWQVEGQNLARLRPDGSNLLEFLLSLEPENVERISSWLYHLTDERFSFHLMELDYHGGNLSEDSNGDDFRNAFPDDSRLLIEDHHNKTRVLPQNSGTGLSQVLPVIASLVGALEKQVTRGPRSLLRNNRPRIALIEQPELHLHPAMQAEVIDVFLGALQMSAEKSRGGSLQIVAETHSEAMLLRLQKRVREGSLAAEDVSLVFVDQFPGDKNAPGGSIAQEIRMAPDGSFRDEWPTSFSDVRWANLQ